jgi:hypothetical protein
VVVANAASQGLWLRKVLGELEGNDPVVPRLLMDNHSVVVLIKNLVLSGQSKNIDVKYHLVREIAKQGSI